MEPTSQPATAAGGAAQSVTVGTLVARTFAVWRGNLAAFAGVSFAVHVATLVAMWAVGSPFLRERARFGTVTPEAQAFIFSGRYWIATGLSILLTVIAAGAVSAGALEHLAGRRATVGEMFDRAVRRLAPLLISAVLALLAFAIGAVLLIVPGVIFVAMYFLNVPIAIAEPVAPLRVNGRSRALTKGHRAKLLALLVIVYLAAYAPTFVLGTVAGGVPYLFTAATLVLNALLGPLFLAAPAVAYHDLRLLKEGADTAHLVRVFE